MTQKMTNNGFFNRLNKAVNLLIGKEEEKEEKKEIKPKRYSKNEISKLKRTMRYNHVDVLILSINNLIKNSTGFGGMGRKNKREMQLFIIELTELKKSGKIKETENNRDIWNNYYVQKEITSILEYLGEIHTNLIKKLNSNNKNKFKITLELQLIEDLRNQFIKLLAK